MHPPASRQQQEAFDELSGETRAGPGPSQQQAGAAGSGTLLPAADLGSGSPPAAGGPPSGNYPLHGGSAEGAPEPVCRTPLQAQGLQQLDRKAGSAHGSVLHTEGMQDERKNTGQQAPVSDGPTRLGSGQNPKQAQLPSANAPAGPLPHHNGLKTAPLNGSGALHAASNGVLVSFAVSAV